MKDKPKCECGVEMREVGGIGKNVETVRLVDGKLTTVGIEEAKLYQCPSCKEIKIK